MGIFDKERENVPEFGAACDGDADRNMILGKQFFVSPSDSVAVLAANANDCIPFFGKKHGGLKAVARSMPTSEALDRVAQAMNIKCFEVPTGWKFFGNLMDANDGKDFTPLICGEESFGTGSNHVREKDGLWAVLAWLSLLAHRNSGTSSSPLVSVEQIVKEHWMKYGRNYYSRYDYEDIDVGAADKLMAHLRSLIDNVPNIKLGGDVGLKFVDDFCYKDIVDGSVSKQQGVRFVFVDGSRFVFRLSGTSSSSATIRMYLEKYQPPPSSSSNNNNNSNADLLHLPVAVALKDLVALAISTSKIQEITGRNAPTVIT